jgi:hypothetical protein
VILFPSGQWQFLVAYFGLGRSLIISFILTRKEIKDEYFYIIDIVLFNVWSWDLF